METHHADSTDTSLPGKFTPPAGLSPELAGRLSEISDGASGRTRA
ncbi:hypothetical protein [Pantoea sp. At-9b]|nr:hypothetical protein [Pantoea sp. At-9b]